MKTPSQTRSTTTKVVMPQHTNPAGTLFGGIMMQWMDECAGICATNHVVTPNGRITACVTVGVDSINFLNPAFVGDQIKLECQVNYTGKTSMEIGCRVTKFNPQIDFEPIKIFSAYLTFVAIGESGKPQPIPQVVPQTKDDKRRNEEAQFRVRIRKRAKRGLHRKFGLWEESV